MILKEVKDILDAELLIGEDRLDLEIKMACGADLLSDVLAFTKSGAILLTGLAHPQVIRTAEIAEIKAICLVRGKQPPSEMVELAKEKHIPLLCTSLPMYESCGRLHSGGIEVSSEEEVHILGLFDEEQSLQDMQQLIDENLSGENNPEFFGRQYVCDEHDAVIGREVKLLIGATRLTAEEVVDSIHRLGGLAVASHVDRESFSILSQLGFVPEGLEIDAVEISPRYSAVEARERFPQIKDYPVVCFSDAHRLEEIGAVSTTFAGASPSVKELRMALFGENGRQMAS